MRDLQDTHHLRLVIKLTDDPIVADAISIGARQTSFQRLNVSAVMRLNFQPVETPI